MNSEPTPQYILEQQGYLVLASLVRHRPGEVLDDVVQAYTDRRQIEHCVVISEASREDFQAQARRFFPGQEWVHPEYSYFHKVVAE